MKNVRYITDDGSVYEDRNFAYFKAVDMHYEWALKEQYERYDKNGNLVYYRRVFPLKRIKDRVKLDTPTKKRVLIRYAYRVETLYKGTVRKERFVHTFIKEFDKG